MRFKRIAAVFSAFLAACAICGAGSAHAQASRDGGRSVMAGVPPVGGTAQFRSAIAVGSVTGATGSPSSAFHDDLTPRRFKDVLSRSLSAAGLAVDGAAARYRLDAHVEAVDYPSSSFVPIAVTVRAIVRYQLVEVASGRVVLATTSDTSATVTRVEIIESVPRANAAIRRSAQASAQRIVGTINNPQVIAR
jgi:hypothetical protein